MPEIRTVATFRYKRDEILSSVQLYERQLAQARAELGHITQQSKSSKLPADPKKMTAYVDTHGMFRRGEPMWRLPSRRHVTRSCVAKLDLLRHLPPSPRMQTTCYVANRSHLSRKLCGILS